MVSDILVVYRSGEGQTATIARRIADSIRDAGARVDVADVDTAPPPDDYRVLVAGDSIHAGRHSRELTRYLQEHVDAARSRPLALFQVSLTSATDDDEHDAEAHRLLRLLLDETGLVPDIVGLFAGALRYTSYGWLRRRVMSSIARSEGVDDDITRDFEYTDWQAVDHFARDAAALAELDDRSAPGSTADRPS